MVETGIIPFPSVQFSITPIFRDGYFPQSNPLQVILLPICSEGRFPIVTVINGRGSLANDWRRAATESETVGQPLCCPQNRPNRHRLITETGQISGIVPKFITDVRKNEREARNFCRHSRYVRQKLPKSPSSVCRYCASTTGTS